MHYTVQFPGLGLSFELNRAALTIGGFSIYWYGILIALGLVLAMAFAFRYAADFGINIDRLIDVICVGTVMSVVCARAYYVAFAPFKYESLWQMIDIRLGGIAIYGAVIGAFVFGGLAAKWRRVPILPLFDLAALGFLIGQCVGRWGNFVNQEAFGTNTDLPWGMYSEGTRDYLAGMQAVLAAEGVTVDPALPVHPTFLYESLWCLAGFLVLWAVFLKRRRFNGQLFLSYVIWYGLGRFWIEGLRTDSLMLTATLRTSQVVALVSVAAAIVLLTAGLQRARGREFTVPLAVMDWAKFDAAKAAGRPFTVDTLPGSAPHAEFMKKTEEMAIRLDALDLSGAAGDEPQGAASAAEQPEEQPKETAAAETAEPAAPTPEAEEKPGLTAE